MYQVGVIINRSQALVHLSQPGKDLLGQFILKGNLQVFAVKNAAAGGAMVPHRAAGGAMVPHRAAGGAMVPHRAAGGQLIGAAVVRGGL